MIAAGMGVRRGAGALYRVEGHGREVPELCVGGARANSSILEMEQKNWGIYRDIGINQLEGWPGNNEGPTELFH